MLSSRIKLLLTKEFMVSATKMDGFRSLSPKSYAGFCIRTPTKSSYDTLELKNQAQWRKWLDQNHNKVQGVWLKIYKKDTVGNPLKYDEALDQALCYGWIDGQRKKFDEKAFLQKFTPRRQKSSWSQRNVGIVKRLEQQGKMMAPGKAEIEKAKKDGRWGN